MDKEIEYLRNCTTETKYMLLNRMQMDIESYINGIKHLYAPTLELQFTYMIYLFNILNDKPEWLTLEQIYEYMELLNIDIDDIDILDT